MSLKWATPIPRSKVTFPEPTAGILHRPRLYQHLQQSTNGLWIGSPAASGKTVLAAAALRACGRPVCWYQVDRDDTDPGTFFHFLGMAIADTMASRRRIAALPLYGREVGEHLDDFARTWLRAAFARLPVGTTLVFDDWHCIPDHHPLQRVLANLFDELPAGNTLWVLSRHAPPASLDSARVRGRLLTLDFGEMMLTLDEVRELVNRQHGYFADAPNPQAERWHGWCGGWIGPLVFALAAGRNDPMSLPAAAAADMSATVFGFLATELFERADHALRDFMLTTAWMPFVSESLVRCAVPTANVSANIADLCRRALLLPVDSGCERTWRFHHLLCEFLRQHSRKLWSPDELAARLIRLATCLESASLPEAAAHLHGEACNWEGLAALLLRHAPQLLRTGRYATLATWVEAIPIDQRTPWVDYWFGAALLARDARLGHLQFERAYNGFWAIGDAEGLYRSWCGVIEGITYACDDYGALEQWLARLRELRQRFPRYPSLLVRAQVSVYGFSATFFLRPQAPEFAPWLRSVQRLYRLSIRRADRAAIGGLLGLYHASITGMGSLGAHLHALRPLLDDPAVPTFYRLVGGLSDVIHHWVSGSTDAALARLDYYTRLAGETGVHAIDRQFAFQHVYVYCLRGDFDAADRYLLRIAADLANLGQIDVSQYYFLAGWRAALGGSFDEAVRLLEVAVDNAHTRRFAFFEVISRSLLAELLATTGQFETAREHSDLAVAVAQSLGSVTAQVACSLQRAAVAELRGDSAEMLPPLLAEAFGYARRHGHWAYGGLYPATLARLCWRALELGIEVAFACELIRRRQLAPPSMAISSHSWPWPLKLFSFGGLRIVREESELIFDSKAQRRPLELLKGLLALGGQHVADTRLIEWLWPGAEGDAGQRALITTLHRLREMLGLKQAITHSGGRLSLNPQLCWFDGLALGACLDSGRIEAGYTLYEGDFLGDEPDPWLIPLREQFQRRVVNGLTTAAEQSRRGGDGPAVERLLNAAIGVDELYEPAYQQLIQHYLSQQQTTLALLTYQRCRRTLAHRLGVMPSPLTVALCQSLDLNTSSNN